MYSDENFDNAVKALSNATILCGDFEAAVSGAEEGDFVFIDSPYYGTFDDYQANGFSTNDHKRLAFVFKELSNRNVRCLLTNSNTEFIKSLYEGYNVNVVPVKRMINRDASNRTGEEVIVTNYSVPINGR